MRTAKYRPVLSSERAPQARPLVREGALHEEASTCRTKESLKLGHGPQRAARHQDILADWLSVANSIATSAISSLGSETGTLLSRKWVLGQWSVSEQDNTVVASQLLLPTIGRNKQPSASWCPDTPHIFGKDWDKVKSVTISRLRPFQRMKWSGWLHRKKNEDGERGGR
jgi:hypothetical protein